MRKSAFFTLLWMLLSVVVYAQSTVTVSGTVNKLADNSPVADHPVYCFAGDSLDPNGGPFFAEGLTDASGAYSIQFNLPSNVSVVHVNTITYCEPDFVSTVIVPIVNNQATANFLVCDDSFPPPPDCWAGIGVVDNGNLTYSFEGYYYGLDSLAQGVTYQWIFGDGTASYEQNPVHTFAQDGIYIITLNVTGEDGCVATTQFFLDTSFNGFPECMGYILYNQTGITSFDFSADIYDANGNPVQANSYLWDFGDGNTSTDAAPSHTYADQGVYTVQLHALTDDSCEIHACDIVFAMDCNVDTFWYGCQAMFATGLLWPDSMNIDPNGGNWDPLTVSFIDLSLGAVTEWSWSFGDGTASNEQNPTHTYATDGIYTVTLSITTLDGCESSATFEICVGDDCWLPEPDCQAMFLPLPDSLGGNGIQFIDLSFTNSPITSWLWTFGDGTASSEQNPYHVYSQPGVYPVTLTIEADSCNSTITFNIDTENPWNFNDPNSPSKLGQSSLSLATNTPKSNLDAVKVFPNPVLDELTVAFNSKKAGDVVINLTDVSGRTLISKPYQAAEGLNAVRMQATSLTPGLYLVELRSGDDIQTLKVVKQ
ncbi:MAG: PKD domain-containing protein [Saprospiraceae bacterium]|nr:PKD domain-containing protein [Saprospiraceae bacterium]